MDSLLIAVGDDPLRLPLPVANRHGLIAGATGTGKTVTLQGMAEGFSRAGVPVFLADVKGDLSGIGAPGADKPKVVERANKLGIPDFTPQAAKVAFWDVFGAQGLPLRATVSDVGPLLMARLLGLNEVQEGLLQLAFKVADDQGLLLLDLKDLQALLGHVAENAKALTVEYGNVAAASVGAIQRGLLALESQGAEAFFGEPALDLADLMRVEDGRGVVNVLAADKLIRSPKLYAGMLLWLLAELFEELPEVGDVEKPKLVFFFDEAHLLFDDAPPALIEQVEQVVRLIRSKGVGVYFVTQSPLDVPETVLGQLGHRVQHALRAFTPRDQKAVRAAAETFRPNPKLDVTQAIQELAVGEALVSLLDENGVPGIVQRALVAPPRSRLGPITPEERRAALAADPLAGRYGQALDRHSAHEMLTGRAAAAAQRPADGGRSNGGYARPGRAAPAEPVPRPSRSRIPSTPAEPADMLMDSLAKGLASGLGRSLGSRVGREIVRGVFGALLRK